jgi:hypothetical protein
MKLVKKVRESFGDDYKSDDGYKTFLEVREDAVVVVERNGVKTLRIYRPQTAD